MNSYPLDHALDELGARRIEIGDLTVAADFGDAASEYAAARDAAGLCDLRPRGLIAVTGADRIAWLHNLVTNAIRPLQPGQGAYTFALNVKGRILFDFNVLILPDAAWLDIDRRWISPAIAHFERYIFTEDVQLTDRTADFVRMAVLGPAAANILQAAAGPASAPLPAAKIFSSSQQLLPLAIRAFPLAGRHRTLVRTDFAGLPAFELYIEAADAETCWGELLAVGRPAGLRPVGWTALESLRIEAGLPASIAELNDTVLPAETGQFARAVSTTKGCYLGQEIVERMRSRGAVARQLVGLKLSQPAAPPVELLREASPAGILTSACHSIGLHAVIGLGYVNVAEAQPGRILSAAGVPAEVSLLPFVDQQPTRPSQSEPESRPAG